MSVLAVGTTTLSKFSPLFVLTTHRSKLTLFSLFVPQGTPLYKIDETTSTWNHGHLQNAVIQISMIGNWVGKHVTDSVDAQNVDATYDGAMRLGAQVAA